jgi:CBS domain-containing protein
MRTLDVGALPVIAHGRLVGMVTDRDLALRVVARGRAETTPVREVMTPAVVICFADEPVGVAAERMALEAVRRLPVLDRDLGLVGVLSVDDLAMYGIDPALVARVLARSAVRRGVECDGVFGER